MHLHSWIVDNLSDQSNVHGHAWSVIFGTACWFIWHWRIKEIFKDNFVWPSHPDFHVMDYVLWIQRAATWQRQAMPLATPKVKTLVGWSKYAVGWVRLNIDGACKGSFASATAGGLIRDEFGA